MALSLAKPPDLGEPVLTLLSSSTIGDDLGGFGERTLPRRPNETGRRKSEERYVLRLLLTSLASAGRLRFPAKVYQPSDDQRLNHSDAVLVLPSESFGVEITRLVDPQHEQLLGTFADAPDYDIPHRINDEPEIDRRWRSWLQDVRQLSEEDAAETYQRFVEYSATGIGSQMTQRHAESVVPMLLAAIERKEKKRAAGRYSAEDRVWLAVYDPHASMRDAANRSTVVRRVQSRSPAHGFAQVSFVDDYRADLDIFGSWIKTDLTKQYATDFVGWTFEQARRLRLQDAEGLDWDALAEEIESLGKRDRRALQSHLQNLFLHLLKWEHQPGKRSASWHRSIRNARNEILDIIADSPSLADKVQELGLTAYRRSLDAAARETGLPQSAFPDRPPWRQENWLNPDQPDGFVEWWIKHGE